MIVFSTEPPSLRRMRIKVSQLVINLLCMERMRLIFIKGLPWFFVLFGLFFLLLINIPIASGACLLLGITILLERIWPEQWEADNN